jgi:FkbM family methyltransferase
MIENFSTKVWACAKKIYYFLGLDKSMAGDIVLRIISKIKKWTPHPNGSFGTEMRLLLRFYEPESVAVCKKIIKPGMTVLDIGADIGYYSLLFSKLVKETGRVYAFEPDPEVFDILSKNIKSSKYKNIHIVQSAISDRSGKAVFFESEKPGRHSLFDTSGQDQDFKIKKRLEVDVVTIDDFLLKHDNPKIDFVKIDIEGAEIKALLGMKNTIAKSKKLGAIIEFNANSHTEDYIKKISEFGFLVKKIDVNSVNLLCLKE